MKKKAVFVIGFIAVLFVVSVAKDSIIQTAVEKGVEVVAGLRLKMGSFHAGIISQTVQIKKLELLNPPGYADKKMIDMPEIMVKYDLPAMVSGKIHLAKVVIHLKEFIVEKNQNGQLNIDQLKPVQAQKGNQKSSGKTPPMKIDDLQLKIEKVMYKDYSKGGAPMAMEFNLNLDERYSNVTDPNALVSLIVVKALMNTTIGNLANFDVRGLESTLGGSVGAAQKVAAVAVAKAQTQVKETMKLTNEGAKKAEEAAKKAEESAKKAANALGDMIKNPFESK